MEDQHQTSPFQHVRRDVKGSAPHQDTLRSRRWFLKSLGAGILLTLSAPSALALSGCDRDKLEEAGDAFFRGERKVVDDMGREVVIPTPEKLERVYFTSALAQIFVFTLNPDVLAGTGIQFTKRELELLPEGYADLTYMGSLSGGGEIDREALVAQDVQLVFSVSGSPLTEANYDEAEKLQEMTGIPVLLVDGSFSAISPAYRFMGSVMGVEERGEQLAATCEQIYADVTAAVADIPYEEKVGLYYAEGPEGLQTEPTASDHALAFDVAGARNVAEVAVTEGIGMSNVSLESVILWDPDVIIAWSAEIRGGADELIRSKSEWQVVRAVREGRVYTMPNTPFAWCDRPPGVNRYLGIQWLANMLYPDRYNIDMVEAVKSFYKQFYWVEISDDYAKGLLANSYPPYRG